MSNDNNSQITENINLEKIKNSQRNRLSSKKFEEKNAQSLEQNEEINIKKTSPIFVYIIFGIVTLIIIFLILIAIFVDKKKKKIESDNINNDIINNDIFEQKIIYNYELNKNNYIPTTMDDNFIFNSSKKFQIVGSNFPQKNNIIIYSKNKKGFIIDEDGKIGNVTEDDFPLFYSLNETITNGSYLFKDVRCFKSIDLSKMDSSKLEDISYMFENSCFEEIYFGTESQSRNLEDELFLEEEEEQRKEYFDTKNIESASNIFNNCINLKKVQFPSDFNVGKNAEGMFKGCIKLEEVNISFIISTNLEQMESMFENCKSLKDIEFSSNFLTGEVKSLTNVFKNTDLINLDMSYLRLYSLENSSNIFDGSSIKGSLKIGKYYSTDELRDSLFKEIAKVTSSETQVFTPSGTTINQIFQKIYFSEKNESISVSIINIDYNINYKQDINYKLYSNKLHFGLGWDYDSRNTYDLDSSILTFTKKITYLSNVYYGHLQEYGGVIRLNGDDLTGTGDGDDEEISISLDLLPSEVDIFTIQLNSFKKNSLKNVISAYIRISTDLEIIGTYSITQAGDNIGLLIGCFFKSTLNGVNSWYFKPLNKVIPGHYVLESLDSIKEYLYYIFNNKLISYIELINRLKTVANGLSIYREEKKYNSLYWNGTHWFTDNTNLIISIINGRDVNNPIIGSYENKFRIIKDNTKANDLILNCSEISSNFSELKNNTPRLLHYKQRNGNGHVGIYLGENILSSKGLVNVIESIKSSGSNSVIYSWVENNGNRREFKGGPLFDEYDWTTHGSLEQWVWS